MAAKRKFYDVDEALTRFEEEVSDFDDSDEEILPANISDEEDHLIEHHELYNLNESDDNTPQSPAVYRERDALHQGEDINEPSDENVRQSREDLSSESSDDETILDAVRRIRSGRMIEKKEKAAQFSHGKSRGRARGRSSGRKIVQETKSGDTARQSNEEREERVRSLQEARGQFQDRGGDRGRGCYRGRGHGRGRGRVRGRGRARMNQEQGAILADNRTYVAKSGRVWSVDPPAARRRPPQNIIRERPGPKPASKKETILETFNLFISQKIKETIVQHTNEEGALAYDKWNEEFAGGDDEVRKVFKEVDVVELNAFIGTLILRGLFAGRNESIKNLWKKSKFSRPIFTACMSRSRFCEWLKLIRFDDRATRAERKYDDNFAPIREVYDMFNSQLRRYLKPSECLTIDEMLVKFRGNDRFRVYMKDKPGKYGLLFWVITDANYRYVLNSIPYAGKPQSQQEERPEAGAIKKVVKDLVEPWRGSGRNISCDRLYTDLDLAEELYNDQHLTMVGTLISNRRHIPQELKRTEGREVNTTMFAFSPPLMMASYCAKPSKVVLMASTMHQDAVVSNEEPYKPDLILYYNETKGGVDTVDMMVRQYTCYITTKRWPVVVFSNMIDVAAVNAFTLWMENHPEDSGMTENSPRRQFLENLGMQLVMPYIERRADNPSGFHLYTRQAIEQVLERKIVDPPQEVQRPMGRSSLPRCSLCVSTAPGSGDYKGKKYNRANKTRGACDNCEANICGKHGRKEVKFLCDNCK